MYRSRSAAVVMLAFLATGCAGLRRGSLLGREGGFGPAVEPPPDAVAMGSFLKGEVALTQNDMETALAAFQAAVRADPDAPLLRLRLAPLYVRSGQLDRALEQVDAVVKLEPTNLEALGLQAGVLSALGRDDEAVATYERLFGARLEHRDTVPDQGVEAASLRVGASRVELLSPLGAETPVGKFIAKRGPGMHHVAYEVDDIRASLADLEAAGAELIDTAPRRGLFGLEVAFVHPDAVHGVLSEVVSLD